MKAIINTGTKLFIGYKFEVEMVNGTKVICNKGRQIIITLENDLFSIYAFTLKGVNIVNEKKISQIYGGENLQNAIKEAYGN